MTPSPRSVPALYKSLGCAIRDRRRQLGMTQQYLSDRLEISRASLASVETGRQRVFIHQLYRLAEHLDTQVSALLPTSEEEANLESLDDLRFSVNLSVSQQEQIARLLGSDKQPINAPQTNEDDHEATSTTGEVSS